MTKKKGRNDKGEKGGIGKQEKSLFYLPFSKGENIQLHKILSCTPAMTVE